jgi:hypothetical protein
MVIIATNAGKVQQRRVPLHSRRVLRAFLGHGFVERLFAEHLCWQSHTCTVERVSEMVMVAAAGSGRFSVPGRRVLRRRGPRVARAFQCPRRSAGHRSGPAAAPVAFGLARPEEIERVARSAGARGVVDLLVGALTDPRVRDDAQLSPHLERLKSACRQTRRYADAVAVFERVAVLNPRRAPEMAVEIALAHAHLGQRPEAVIRLRRAVAAFRALPVGRRDDRFLPVAETAAMVLREPELAREIVAL